MATLKKILITIWSLSFNSLVNIEFILPLEWLCYYFEILFSVLLTGQTMAIFTDLIFHSRCKKLLTFVNKCGLRIVNINRQGKTKFNTWMFLARRKKKIVSGWLLLKVFFLLDLHYILIRPTHNLTHTFIFLFFSRDFLFWELIYF